MSKKPKQWLIGFTGFAQSGKDTAANYLVEMLGYHRVSYAAPLKDAVVALNPLTQLDNGKYVYLGDHVKLVGMDEAKKNCDVRRLLQRMGTEVGRDIFGEDFWVDQTFKAMADLEYQGIADQFVITDVRFPNEVDRIHDTGGIVVRIDRPGIGPVNAHSSDMMVNTIEPDVWLMNDGSIEDLYTKIEGILTW